MSNKINNKECGKIILSISEYLNGELSLKEREEFERHCEECDSCRLTLEEEKVFETILKEASTEDDKNIAIDERQMERIERGIIESIKVTQMEGQPRIEKIYERMTQKSISISKNEVKTNNIFSAIFTKPGLALVSSLAVLVITLVLLVKFNNPKSDRAAELALEKEIKAKFTAKLTSYQNRHDVSNLYGINEVRKYDVYINALAYDLKNFDKSFQKTILYKLENTNLTNVKNKNKIATIEYVKFE